MPYTSGSYALYTPGNPVVSGTTISSTAFNNTMNDIASALSTCVLKDGTQTVTSNIPMSSFKLTGLAAGSSSGDSVRYEQLTAAVGTVTQNSQNAGYTLVLSDAGKHILMATAGTFTIPSNASVAFPIGSAVSFVNATTSCTIPITSDTMTLAGTSTTGTRTLAANGIATALKIGTTSWIISGTGLS